MQPPYFLRRGLPPGEGNKAAALEASTYQQFICLDKMNNWSSKPLFLLKKVLVIQGFSLEAVSLDTEDKQVAKEFTSSILSSITMTIFNGSQEGYRTKYLPPPQKPPQN